MDRLCYVFQNVSQLFLESAGIRFSQGLGRRFTMAEPQKGCSQWHRRRSSEQKEELTVRFCAILDHLERAIRASRHVYSSRAGWLGPTARPRSQEPSARPDCRVVVDPVGAADGLGPGDPFERAAPTRQSAQVFAWATSFPCQGTTPRLPPTAMHNHQLTRTAWMTRPS